MHLGQSRAVNQDAPDSIESISRRQNTRDSGYALTGIVTNKLCGKEHA